jgi:hypothetical protein
MTPSAVTSAGRTRTGARSGASVPSARAAGAGARTASAAAARVAVPRPARGAAVPAPRPARPAPTRPRRVSGPVAPTRRPATEPLPRRAALGTVEFFRTLPDHRLLDRLVRGRAWIPVLGVLLAGIVATQVEVLKLGASMGRWMDRSAALTSHNQALQASVASLSDDQRIERLAAGMGMVMPAPTSITFLSRRSGGRARVAVSGIHAPDPAQFEATLQSQAAAAAALSPPPPPSTSSPGPGSPAAGVGVTASSSAVGTTSAGVPSTGVTPATISSQSTGG